MAPSSNMLPHQRPNSNPIPQSAAEERRASDSKRTGISQRFEAVENEELTELLKANVVGVFAEALTADVEVIFANQAGLVSADAALTRAFAIATGAREPDLFVTHFEAMDMRDFAEARGERGGKKHGV